MSNQEWPLWEIFIRSKAGLDHKHVGSCCRLNYGYRNG
jgi:ring-1,2-phenylacetyl-CoA epoxidase subunit PaaB